MRFEIQPYETPAPPEPKIGLKLSPGLDGSILLVASAGGVTRTIMRFENGGFWRSAHDPLVTMPGLQVDEFGRIKEAD